MDWRASGILLHVTSLPGPNGAGDFGASAYQFVDSMVRARQGIWQVLPLGPTGYGDSPYQSYSAFAGNPVLVDLDELTELGWLTAAELADGPLPSADQVEFEQITPWRQSKLHLAYQRFVASATRSQKADLQTFREQNQKWLDDYALFMALKELFGGVQWTRWPSGPASREPAALAELQNALSDELEFQVFVQWCFFRQWRALKDYANVRGVRIIGDVPIFLAHDSADVWAQRRLFQLQDSGEPRFVAGVPPDYFSATGQLWGNPLYDWDYAAATGYEWWLRRLEQALNLFDWVRLDHFRGFAAHWEIPADNRTAAGGRWVPGPGAAFFTAAVKRLGRLPLIAEDLGVITPDVEALRDQFGLPGMRVLQFAFGDDPKAPDYRPHNYIPNCAVYTGTHDNDTTVGWFQSVAGAGTTRSVQQIARERDFTLRYLQTDGSEIHWDMIRLAVASVARLAVFPMQDVLGLGSEARMNMPSTSQGNWRWRMQPGQLTRRHEERLAALAEIYGRSLFPTSPMEAGA
jgi:4-alpha-glucanotransferase